MNFKRLFFLPLMFVASLALAAPNVASGPSSASLIQGSIFATGGVQAQGSIALAPLGTPGTGTVQQTGTAGSTTYTYRCVGQDINGNETIPSSSFTTTTGNATLSATNFNTVFCPATAGVVGWRLLKADNAHSIATCNTPSGGSCPLVDNSTSAGSGYTANTVDQTGSVTSALITSANTAALQESSAGSSITTVTCQNQTAFTVTGATANMGCNCSWSAGVPASNPTAAILGCFMSTNSLTPVLCNPTASSVTPTATAFNCRVIP